jgi:SpoIID/LytB domain protein
VVTLQAQVLPTDANQSVRWESSDESIAIVDVYGNIISYKTGIVTITATHSEKSTIIATHIIEIISPPIVDEYEYNHTKVLSIDRSGNNIEFLDCQVTKIDENTKVYVKSNDKITETTMDELYIGMDNLYIEANVMSNLVTKILIDGDKGFSNIRVAIRKSINDISQSATLYHDDAEIYTNRVTTLKTFDGKFSEEIPANTVVTISIEENNIKVSMGTTTLINTNKRIIFVQSEQGTIQFRSIIRSFGIPSYQGNLEFSFVNQRLLVVNDVNLELYLTKVVPSEMPVSFHAEALKSQAVAARTYAYMDIMRRTNEKYGFTVDDSVSSQVYNNQATHPNTTAAVLATTGLIMMNEGTPIKAYYYSTSSGLTASAHEVWISNEIIDPVSYLIGKNLATDGLGNPIEIDTSSEESMLDFFKLITMNTPDLNAGLHRWKIEFTKQQLTNTLNVNLKLMYALYPQSVLTYYYGSGEWRSESILNDVGEIYNISINERGESGVVVSLLIDAHAGTFLIINQFNIRFTLRPQDAGSTVVRYGAKNTDLMYTSTANNVSILPSGFFAIEKTGDNYAFYGGGNGHGVGMSQYGAHGLGTTGKTYQQILTTYYSNTDIIDITYDNSPIANYEQLLKNIA